VRLSIFGETCRIAGKALGDTPVLLVARRESVYLHIASPGGDDGVHAEAHIEHPCTIPRVRHGGLTVAS
jgi:hypothetical protein